MFNNFTFGALTWDEPKQLTLTPNANFVNTPPIFDLLHNVNSIIIQIRPQWDSLCIYIYICLFVLPAYGAKVFKLVLRQARPRVIQYPCIDVLSNVGVITDADQE